MVTSSILPDAVIALEIIESSTDNTTEKLELKLFCNPGSKNQSTYPFQNYLFEIGTSKE